MIVQLFLSALLAGVAFTIAVQQTTSRFLRSVILIVIAAGGVLVWAPDAATAVARAIGVGRGADLLLYVWIVITLALMVFLYLKVVRLRRKMTQLARAVALLHPMLPANHGNQAGDVLD